MQTMSAVYTWYMYIFLTIRRTYHHRHGRRRPSFPSWIGMAGWDAVLQKRHGLRRIWPRRADGKCFGLRHEMHWGPRCAFGQWDVIEWTHTQLKHSVYSTKKKNLPNKHGTESQSQGEIHTNVHQNQSNLIICTFLSALRVSHFFSMP